MGVRLYTPATGRFLSVDPVHGGNAGAYEYVHADPLSRFDLDGKRCWFGKNRNGSCRGARAARFVGYAAITVGADLATGVVCAATAIVGCVLAGAATGAFAGGGSYVVNRNMGAKRCTRSGFAGRGTEVRRNGWTRWSLPWSKSSGKHGYKRGRHHRQGTVPPSLPGRQYMDCCWVRPQRVGPNSVSTSQGEYSDNRTE